MLTKIGFRQGIALALQWSQLPVLVETDCQAVVAAGTGKGKDWSRFACLIDEIRFLVSQGWPFSFVKGDRSQKRASHALANIARMEMHTVVWQGSGPSPMMDVVLQDCTS